MRMGQNPPLSLAAPRATMGWLKVAVISKPAAMLSVGPSGARCTTISGGAAKREGASRRVKARVLSMVAPSEKGS
jgi:hypothetical protein